MKLRNVLLGMGNAIASIALMMGVSTVQTACFVFYHQPKVPQGMEKFRIK